MFTGLVQAVGEVAAIASSEGGSRLTVRAPGIVAEVAPGDSVAVSGVCLTAVSIDGVSFAADVVPETLERSTLGALAAGDAVNLELALRAGDRLGGHMVQGHVDGAGTVLAAETEGTSTRVTIGAELEVLVHVIEKGSITVDGVSLTVAAVGPESFTVALIPETLQRTTLGAAGPGRAVNLEADMVAKHLAKLAAASLPRP